MSTAFQHQPVLMQEVLQALAIKPDGIYLDCTFGRGGHSRAILQHLGEQGRLLAMDRDPQAGQTAAQINDPRFQFYAGAFAEQLQMLLDKQDMLGKIDGILLDLGVSSPQLDDSERGFSFLHDGPLDMRMDPEQGISVAEWLLQADEKQLADILFDYGEERFSRRIAKAIIEQQQQQPITRTKQLADIIAQANPNWEKHKHPATRSFQALRIFINREMQQLHDALPLALQLLMSGGRLAVICFHALEARMVKQFFTQCGKQEPALKGLPIADRDIQMVRLKRVGKAIKPSMAELTDNIRSRSAVLRVAEKLL